MTADRLERYADLALKVGVNLQPGQPLMINADVEHAPLVRVIADRAWRTGASTVFVYYGDADLRKSLVDLAPEAALTASAPGTVAHARRADRAACCLHQGGRRPCAGPAGSIGSRAQWPRVPGRFHAALGEGDRPPRSCVDAGGLPRRGMGATGVR